MKATKLSLFTSALLLAIPMVASHAHAETVPGDPISPDQPGTAVATPDPTGDVTSEPAPGVPRPVPTSEMGAAEEPLDLGALGISEDRGSGASAQDTADPPLNLYGFADFGVLAPLYGKSSAWSSIYTHNNTRALIGNLNLYLSRQLYTKWSMLAEVRFHYLPAQTLEDPADSYRFVSWGGIEIERAHVDYQAHQWFNLRMGSWLTPYGIWNVDHGTPTLIAIRRPYSIGEQLFPERQTGFLVYGGDFVGPVRLGYQLGVSNGRGPRDTFDDLDQNKAVTARLEAAYRGGIGELKVGVTAYSGRYTSAKLPTLDLASGTSTENRSEVYDELSFGADLQYDFEGLALRAEYLRNEQKYDDKHRFKAGSIYAPDNTRFGFYALIGYRIRALGLMPYVLFENYHFGELSLYLRRAHIIYYGLNYHISPRLVAKAELVTVRFPDVVEALANNDLKFIQTQLAWAF